MLLLIRNRTAWLLGYFAYFLICFHFSINCDSLVCYSFFFINSLFLVLFVGLYHSKNIILSCIVFCLLSQGLINLIWTPVNFFFPLSSTIINGIALVHQLGFHCFFPDYWILLFKLPEVFDSLAVFYFQTSTIWDEFFRQTNSTSLNQTVYIIKKVM